jgi:hypothetical protein
MVAWGRGLIQWRQQGWPACCCWQPTAWGQPNGVGAGSLASGCDVGPPLNVQMQYARQQRLLLLLSLLLSQLLQLQLQVQFHTLQAGRACRHPPAAAATVRAGSGGAAGACCGWLLRLGICRRLAAAGQRRRRLAEAGRWRRCCRFSCCCATAADKLGPLGHQACQLELCQAAAAAALLKGGCCCGVWVHRRLAAAVAAERRGGAYKAPLQPQQQLAVILQQVETGDAQRGGLGGQQQGRGHFQDCRHRAARGSALHIPSLRQSRRAARQTNA